MRSLKLTGLLMLLLTLNSFNQSIAQTTTWRFDAANNSGYTVRITASGENHSISKVELGKVGSNWVAAAIQEMDDYEEYIRIKSGSTGRIYELYVNWETGKLTQVNPEGTKEVYWLKKS